jgi:hypothetical protein
MKLRTSLFHAGAIAVSVSSFLLVGCSKKETKAEPPAVAAAPQPAAVTAKQTAEQMAAAAQRTAAAGSQMAAAGAETARKEAQTATAAVAEMQKSAQSSLAATPPTPAAPATPTPAAAAPVTASVQQQAADLYTRYSAELDVVTKNAAALKKIVDQNLAMLPAGVQTKYKEFNALLPGLTTLVGSLKDYQKVDLATIVPKLQTDFAKVQKLYGEIRGMLPQSLPVPAP